MADTIRIISSKIREIHNILINADKVSNLPDDVIQKISQEINQEMSKVRQEFFRKEGISNQDTSKVILNS
jgi:hypothetical protein